MRRRLPIEIKRFVSFIRNVPFLPCCRGNSIVSGLLEPAGIAQNVAGITEMLMGIGEMLD
jgi:hypothetical protein